MDKEDWIVTICAILFIIMIIGFAIYFINGAEKVSKNKNDACMKLGYDKFMHYGYKSYCVDTQTGKMVRVIGNCGVSKESCVIALWRER